jgi:branched-chain amino acid transport system substrate-binding protein
MLCAARRAAGNLPEVRRRCLQIATLYPAGLETQMRKAMLALAAIVMVAAGVASARAEEVIKIGLIMAYTGQFADGAAQMDHGISLYMKQHGDTIAGKKIELIRKDTAGIPENAKRLAQELIVNDHVDILAGFTITPEILSITDLVSEAKKFTVVMNAATAIITTKSPYIVRTSLTLPQNCETLGSWAAKNGTTNAFTMVSDYAPGHDAEAAFQRAFTADGGKIVGSVRIPLANPDFSAYVQRAKDSGADSVFVFVPGGSQPAALAKALVERGMDPSKMKIMGQGELADESALKAMGSRAVGIITAFHYDHTHESAENKKFVAAYNAEFRRTPDHFSIGGYDGMHLIYQALKKTGASTDPEKLVGAAKGMSWESPRGKIAIDPDTRDVVNTVYIHRVEDVKGEIRNVEIAKFENVKDPVKARIK